MLGRIPGRGCWLVATLVVGMAMGSLAPYTPLHAVATDHNDRFAVATGALDEVTEAIYYLDFATGELRAAVINPVTRRFNAFFNANVQAALRTDAAKNPKYLLVTGNTIFRTNAGALQPGNSVIYVAELTSGNLAAYNVPWSPNFANTGTPIRMSMNLLDVIPIRTASLPAQQAVREK
jgi:hypothetical protein